MEAAKEINYINNKMCNEDRFMVCTIRENAHDKGNAAFKTKC